MHKSKQPSRQSFVMALESLLEKTSQAGEITVGQIFAILSKRGYAALLMLLSFSFCIPVQIPGFSTPFGLVLGFLGLRIMFAKHLWWPHWILEKHMSNQHVHKLCKAVLTFVQKMQKIVHPRLTILTNTIIFLRIHGLIVFMLSILLSLPLPIPMSNMLSALPIFFIGLGMLEDDGVMMIIGYLLAAICFLAFFGLFVLGKAALFG